MKKLLIILLFFPLALQAQVVLQKAYVRKITYSKNSVNVPLADVRVKVETEERSDPNGYVTLKISSTSDNTFLFADIIKMGYTPVSPSSSDLRVKKYALNPRTTIEIVLVDNKEQLAERTRIENNIRKEKEAEIAGYRTQLENKEAELAKYKETDRQYFKMKQERDSIEHVMRDFSLKYYESDKIIMEEADKLSRIDYKTLDSIEQVNIELRKAGKGSDIVAFNKSLLSQKDAYIAQNIEQELAQSDSVIQTRERELEKLRKENREKLALRDFIAQRYKDIAEGYKIDYENDSALVYFKKRTDLDPTNAEYIEDYASFLSFTARYAEAQTIYSRALKIRMEKNGANSIEAATLYNHIGFIYNKQGDFTKALGYYSKALAIRSKVYDEDHPDLATSYNSIGTYYVNLGDYLKALEYHTKALAIREKVFRKDHPDLAISYNNIGFIYDKQGDFAKALEYYTKALAIFEKMYGKDHPDLATSYNNIGKVYNNQGDYTKALEFYTKALAIREKVFSKDHPDLAISYINIGAVYDDQGDYSKALEYYNKALAISEKVFGKDHPDLATSYNNIGLVYANQGDYSKALEYYTKALAIKEKVFSKDHPNLAISYINIGGVYFKQGDYAKALEYYAKALTIFEKVYGKEHPDVATSYNNIGVVYDSEGDYAKALEYFSKAMEIRKKVLGEEHPDLAISYNNIGFVYYSKGEYSNALEYFTKALEIREKVFGNNHQKTISVRNQIQMINLFLTPYHIYTIEVVKGGEVFKKGTSQKYQVLYYEGWEIGKTSDLFQHNLTLKGKPKRIVVMNDTGIYEYNFGAEMTEIMLDIEEVSAGRYAEIMKQYDDWKKQNKK